MLIAFTIYAWVPLHIALALARLHVALALAPLHGLSQSLPLAWGK